MMRYVVLICALAACVAWAAEHENCGECDREKCPRLTEANCTTGLVHDKCQCCFACGREEGQLCNNRDEKCGEDLECTFREDPRLDDQPQATCVCKYSELLCAEDGRTFRNLCQLMAESFRSNTTIKLKSRGPCRAAPKVISSTGDMVVDAGDELMLACESDGYPIPVVGWTYTGAAGSFINLPVDDHMAIQARGGPEALQVTAWLQVLSARLSDDGEYNCFAQNELGTAHKTLKVTVKDANSIDEKTQNDDL